MGVISAVAAESSGTLSRMQRGGEKGSLTMEYRLMCLLCLLFFFIGRVLLTEQRRVHVALVEQFAQKRRKRSCFFFLLLVGL